MIPCDIGFTGIGTGIRFANPLSRCSFLFSTNCLLAIFKDVFVISATTEVSISFSLWIRSFLFCFRKDFTIFFFAAKLMFKNFTRVRV